MNASLLKNKNALIILLCAAVIVLIYSIDIFPLAMFDLNALKIAMRCAIAPILLGLALRSLAILLRKPDPSRQIRRW